MDFDWSREIAIARLVNEKRHSLDVKGIFPRGLPESPAKEADIQLVAKVLREPVD